MTNICQATNKQLFQLVDWAKHIPHFTSLPLQDQVLLLRAGWNELLIAAFSHRSIEARDGIVLATGLTIQRYCPLFLVDFSLFSIILTLREMILLAEDDSLIVNNACNINKPYKFKKHFSQRIFFLNRRSIVHNDCK